MRWAGTCYRAHDPRWAWTPTSGDGAALKGGRFNPIGVPALYLATSIEGMLIEMGYGFARRFDPLTICSYSVDVDGIVDLRTEADCQAAGVNWKSLSCAWAYDVACGREPETWALAKQLRSNGTAGIIVPSFAVGARAEMANLVLWTWGPDLPHQVLVHDPSGRLPKDASSSGPG